ncbi:MAG: hypothetical protein C5B59_02270 [Bacteroidetes bacterium]|nr:MAG: hypothetical protein C5B59_02270 [Bacteroidota bacterium]
MNKADAVAFISLFKDAVQKCFGHIPPLPMSEAESKLMANQVFEKTGLVIGAKSLKNYSGWVMDLSKGKEENPSVSTMDTLARYALDAPATDEIQRKNKESHFPYWYQYKEQFYKKKEVAIKSTVPIPLLLLAGILVIVVFFIGHHPVNPMAAKPFVEDFHSLSPDSLNEHDWFVKGEDTLYWNQRASKANHLALFTLKGDNWPDSTGKALSIKNLLVRKIEDECFTTEVHLSGFVPAQNWQQAGILLLEDTNFKGKALRLSIAYNDFFGGFSVPKEIIVQAITSSGEGSNKPEEVAHKILFNPAAGNEELIKGNMQKSGLRIEKKQNRIRLLYSSSPMENFAFKEAVNFEFDFHPKYIALFALKGPVDQAEVMPAYFSYFSFDGLPCNP